MKKEVKIADKIVESGRKNTGRMDNSFETDEDENE